MSELAAPPRAYGAIAHYLASMAAPGGRIEASVPRDHPFCAFWRRVGCVELATHPWCVAPAS